MLIFSDLFTSYLKTREQSRDGQNLDDYLNQECSEYLVKQEELVQ